MATETLSEANKVPSYDRWSVKDSPAATPDQCESCGAASAHGVTEEVGRVAIDPPPKPSRLQAGFRLGIRGTRMKGLQFRLTTGITGVGC